MPSVAKIYTSVQIYLTLFLSILLLGYGLYLRVVKGEDEQREKRRKNANLIIIVSSIVILLYIFLIYLRSRIPEFDNYYTALGIMR